MWLYKILRVELSKREDFDAIEHELRVEGLDGWEAYAVLPNDSGDAYGPEELITIFLKKWVADE